jgi:cysteine desulfurase
MNKSPMPLTGEAFVAHGKNIYFDHNATAPIAGFIREALPELADQWGNAGSIHFTGRGPKAILRETRQKLAAFLGCHPLELVFTSGGSESNNYALIGLADWCLANGRTHLMVSSVEHPSIIKTCEYLKTKGFTIDHIPVQRTGEIDLEFIRSKLSDKTGLVSVMLANNETGSIFPVEEITKMAHSVGAYMHCDGVQALGKMEFNVAALGVDLMTFSAHKFYSLKGTGILFVKRGTPIENLIWGGAQERFRRAGTENILSIAALGLMTNSKPFLAKLCNDTRLLRDEMETLILKEIDGVTINGNGVERVCGSSNLVLDGVDGETLLMNLDLKGFSVSTGAACSSGNPEPSPVLLAMGLTRQEAQYSLRVSLGWGNTRDEVLKFVEILKQVVVRIRGLEKR